MLKGFPGGSAGKESTYSAGDLVWSRGQEDPREKWKATHSSNLAGESHCSPKGSSVHGILYTQGKPFTKYNFCHHQIGCFKLDKVRHVQGGLAIDRITLILMIWC